MNIKLPKILQKGLNLSSFKPLYQAVIYKEQRSTCKRCMSTQSEEPQKCYTPRFLNTHELDSCSSFQFHDCLF